MEGSRLCWFGYLVEYEQWLCRYKHAEVGESPGIRSERWFVMHRRTKGWLVSLNIGLDWGDPKMEQSKVKEDVVVLKLIEKNTKHSKSELPQLFFYLQIKSSVLHSWRFSARCICPSSNSEILLQQVGICHFILQMEAIPRLAVLRAV